MLGRDTRSASQSADDESSSRGQVLILFALMLTVLIGMAAFVVDIAWIWSHQLKVQRAADAGALAGVVWLPGNEPAAATAATKAVTANGYTHGVDGAVVTAVEDPTDPNRIVVDVSAPVETFFMRLFGWSEVTVARTARAEYVLPVPMGSPENYYGVFGQLRTPNGGTTVQTPGDTGWLNASAIQGSTVWSGSGNVYTSNNSYASASSTSSRQGWGNFNITVPAGATVRGIEVGLEASYSGTGTTSNCRIAVDLSDDDGDESFTSDKYTPALTTADPAGPYYVLGSSTDLWGESNWTSSEVSNSNFWVRAWPDKPTCSSGIVHRIDHLRVRVHYTTNTLIPDANLAGPNGEVLNPRGFWGTMLGQGSIDVDGDAYLPMYDQRTSKLNPDYSPDGHYDYAVEMPAGSSNGQVWIFDPVFCATDAGGQYGTGDRALRSGVQAMSAFYYLYDTNGTIHDTGDDTLVSSSGDLFKNIRAADPSLGGTVGGSVSSCQQGAVTNQADGRYWHNRWWQFPNASLQGGRTYRVRTSTTDPNSATAQQNADGQNSFAIWTTATGEAPDVYGIGAMEAYTPLKAGEAATFYLAQIDAIHAGKTVRIELWDPGDTQSLPANLQILIPTTSGYTPATFDWTAAEGSTNTGFGTAANCVQRSGAGVSSISTNIGGTQQFQGCWVTIEIPIPVDYTAPQPAGEPEPGWWKINYAMGGSGTTTAYDVTTWQVEIRGNPVHLVVP